MKPHGYQFGDQPWPEGKGVLQVYAPLDRSLNSQVAELADSARVAMEGAPVSFVDFAELHVTLDLVADVTIEQMSQAERTRWRRRCGSGSARSRCTAESPAAPVAYAVGPILDVCPAAPLVELQRATREVIQRLRSDAACTFRQTKPHLSLGYCHTETETDPWSRKLRKIDPAHAPLTITSVELVDVRPDNLTKQLSWTAVAPPILLRG